MTEEEKQAIITLKFLATAKSYGDLPFRESDSLKVCLNLIEKLQKENEELRKNQKYKKDFNGEKIFCLEYDKETLRDMVLEKQEEIKELKSNSIPKDKIREYIKEKEEEKEGVKNISLEEYAITSKELKESEICLLKCLLEEE